MNDLETQAVPEQRADILAKVKEREAGMLDWLKLNAPYVFGEQKHLDEKTPERAYWHYGYMVACRDILNKLEN